MSETVRVTIDHDALRDSLGDAQREVIDTIAQDLAPLAAEMEVLFRDVGRTITAELAEAAAQGKLSIKDLVNSALEDLARLAAEELIRAPLEGLLSGQVGTSARTQDIADPLRQSRSQLSAALSGALARGARNG